MLRTYSTKRKRDANPLRWNLREEEGRRNKRNIRALRVRENRRERGKKRNKKRRGKRN